MPCAVAGLSALYRCHSLAIVLLANEHCAERHCDVGRLAWSEDTNRSS